MYKKHVDCSYRNCDPATEREGAQSEEVQHTRHIAADCVGLWMCVQKTSRNQAKRLGCTTCGAMSVGNGRRERGIEGSMREHTNHTRVPHTSPTSGMRFVQRRVIDALAQRKDLRIVGSGGRGQVVVVVVVVTCRQPQRWRLIAAQQNRRLSSDIRMYGRTTMFDGRRPFDPQRWSIVRIVMV